MKKQRKKPQTKAKNPQTPQPRPEASAKVTRRTALTWLRNGAIALPAIGAAGYFGTRAVQASICELDLSKVGTGLPSVVQIHDPNCPLCQTLQQQTRRALRQYDDAGFHYLVANINTVEGSTFANRHGVPHVTLLLMDGAGEVVEVVRGPVNDAQLELSLNRHLGDLG